MNSISTPLDPDFVKESLETLMNGVAEATIHTYRVFWEILLSFLAQHWLATLGAMIAILIYAIARFLITGRWRVLGSVLYNYFYFGILFVIGLIGGPELYANDYFPIIATIVYIVSFSIVGFILLTTGVRTHYRRR